MRTGGGGGLIYNYIFMETRDADDLKSEILVLLELYICLKADFY